MGTPLSETDEGLRRVVARVALLNLAYFGVEFSVALAIGSVSLFADSIDFLEGVVAGNARPLRPEISLAAKIAGRV
jgi:Co/Zn/Cd efflux system component